MKKLTSMIALLLCVLLLGGCTDGEPQASSSEAASSATSAPEGTNASGASEESSQAPEAEDPAESVDTGTVNGDGTRTIVDMAGRTVTMPVDIKRVYCAVPTAEALMCTLVPDKLVGWVNTPSEDAKQYLIPEVADLPVVGGWMGQQVTASMEDIIAIEPDVIIYMTTLNIAPSGDDTADAIAEQSGCPVFVVNSMLANTPYIYRLLGEILGVSERGNMLADYCEDKLEMVKGYVSAVPEEEKVRVYYAEGPEGLATDPSGSGHTEVLDFVGIQNVAEVEMLGGQGMTAVSIEQVLTWDPEVILVSANAPSTLSSIQTSGIWNDIQAVKDGKIYKTPAYPFNWFDRPPNMMRVLGCVWFAELMYPDYCDIDVNSEIKDFFQLFYNVELSDEQIAALSGL